MKCAIMLRTFCFTLLILGLSCATAKSQEKPANLHDVKSDLTVPPVTDDEPAAGRRVRHKHPGFDDWNLYHVLYLPPDWRPGEKYPILVEYPGNGGFRNALGDVCTGKIEDCCLGYGISGGKNFLWVCLPFVETQQRRHSLNWWADADATSAYCRQTVKRLCDDFGGDAAAVILTGFSRGAIACNYIGLRDDETAKLWRAMVVHSNYDGVRKWGQPDDDAVTARKRLERYGDRPQFVTHELSVDDTRKFLKYTKVRATLLALPYPNHSDAWVLKDIPARAALRKWIATVLQP